MRMPPYRFTMRLRGASGLQPHNHLIIPVNIPRRKIINAGDGVGFHVNDALLHFFHNQRTAFFPNFFGAGSGSGQEAFVSRYKGYNFSE